MKTKTYLLVALFLGVVLGAAYVFWPSAARSRAALAPRPELDYLKAMNSAGPPHDPQLLFLLMAQYSNAERQEEGAAFFSARLQEFGPRLTDVQKSLYLSAIGLLRAQHASAVPLLRRIGYVKQTIAMLDDAKQLSKGQVFVVNWIAGVVRTELPGIFRQRDAAQQELAWCEQNQDQAPHAGWLREVYYHQAKLALAKGDANKAQAYLGKSGYKDFDRPVVLITPFSEEAAFGNAFAPRRVAAVVPGRVYVLTGFEFTEYYFVVSDDGRQLIGIDAGTRPDSAKAAYEALRAFAPGIPELTTVLITHSHWDHIGGHKYFRALNSHPKFYARSNYQQELALELAGPAVFGKQFFGDRFNVEDVRSFKPDATINRPTELKIGGTRIELIPVQGGETHDALFVNLPDLGVLFVGDFIMPYIGAPFVEEGDVQGLLDAIDVVTEKKPRFILHGHEPLTHNFGPVEVLAELKVHLAWLRQQVLDAVARGEERGAIHQANLIPPNLIGGDPRVPLPYLILREHVIDRLYDQNVGYWQADLQGVDHLRRADRAELLVDYLGVSESQMLKAVERLTADGRYELAASLLESSGGRFDGSLAVRKARRFVYLKLMEQSQNTDPFKFILYSAKIGEQTPQMPSGN